MQCILTGTQQLNSSFKSHIYIYTLSHICFNFVIVKACKLKLKMAVVSEFTNISQSCENLCSF